MVRCMAANRFQTSRRMTRFEMPKSRLATQVCTSTRSYPFPRRVADRGGWRREEVEKVLVDGEKVNGALEMHEGLSSGVVEHGVLLGGDEGVVEGVDERLVGEDEEEFTALPLGGELVREEVDEYEQARPYALTDGVTGEVEDTDLKPGFPMIDTDTTFRNYKFRVIFGVRDLKVENDVIPGGKVKELEDVECGRL